MARCTCLCLGVRGHVIYIVIHLIPMYILLVITCMLILTTIDFAFTLTSIGIAMGGAFGCLILIFSLLVTIYLPGSCLKTYFPVCCGRKSLPFTGRSSKSLQDLLLKIDTKIQSEEEFLEAESKAVLFLQDIKRKLEEEFAQIAFNMIITGSVAERWGITSCIMSSPSLALLNSDLDVMFCFDPDVLVATFSGFGNVRIEPCTWSASDGGENGHAQLRYVHRSRGEEDIVSSTTLHQKARKSLENRTVFPNFPLMHFLSRINVSSQGPAINIMINNIMTRNNSRKTFMSDITLCIKCPEWPSFSDWHTRPRNWPSAEDVRKIALKGCHLVPKPELTDKEKTGWRFSFSIAEVELSKLVPNTARKCFLALRIILKDHLQPVLPKFSSYILKTMFFNTLERELVGFWVDENIEQCFLLLLAELYHALMTGRCVHHFISSVNLIEWNAKTVQPLIVKVKRILENPAPFIFDDGCCCILPCCSRVVKYYFPRNGRQQTFQTDFESFVVCVDPTGKLYTSEIQTPMYHTPTPLSLPRPCPMVDPQVQATGNSNQEHNQINPARNSAQSVVTHLPGNNKQQLLTVNSNVYLYGATDDRDTDQIETANDDIESLYILTESATL